MARPAQSPSMQGRREVTFERIGEVLESEHRQALTEYALTELLWHRSGAAVTGFAGSDSAGRSRHAA